LINGTIQVIKSSYPLDNHTVEAQASEVTSLKKGNVDLTSKVDQLQHQQDCFKRHLFGQKPKKRQLIDPAIQPRFLEDL